MGFGLGFEWRVAMRFLREGRMQTLLIVVGVAAGVAVIAYISALVEGLQGNTLSKTLGAQAHVTLRAPDERVTPALALPPQATALTQTQARAQRLRSVANWQALVPLLEADPAIATVSPLVSGSGLALRGEASLAVAVTGVELDRYDRLVSLRSKVVAGAARLEPGDAILGRELAIDLGLQVGDRLTLQTASTNDSVRITALVDLGLRDLNRRTAIVPLRTAQALFALPGGATGLDLALRDVWAAQGVTDALRQRHPYKIESWQESNAQLVSALNAQTVSTTLIRVVVAAVVVLGIASVLVVSVVQKRREIGILRAMGATRGQMQRVFLVQGAMVAALGSALGIVLAVVMIWAFTNFVRGSDGQPLFFVTLPPRTAVQVAALALVCGVLAAIMPARRAAAMDPAQAIRL
ncbi:ABC transporter permease [Ramlibacter sp. MAHUQ-53]|uniref:ABC transporter permease n=1 Tax=unclassified Ramlibacter TaxID=2617605 RepID=UPI0036347806